MRLFLKILFLALFVQSCYTPEKAQKQQEKILRKHPEVAAEKIRTAFPCVTTATDSSGFLQSISTLDSLLNETRIKYIESSERFQHIRDSLESVLNSDSTMKCEDENKALLDYASGLQVKNENLVKEANRNTEIIKALSSQIKNIKPVIVETEDSAKIYLAMKAQIKAELQTESWKAKYEVDHQWRVEKEAQEKGKLIIRIPWLWIILLSVVLSTVGVAWFKMGTLNPFRLFFKSKHK